MKSIEEALPYYENVLGLKCYKTEVVEDQKVKTAFLMVGQTKLELLEPTNEHEPLAMMLAGEKGYSYSPSRLSDQDVCKLIDGEYVPGYHADSVYRLSREQRVRIGDDLVRRLRIAPAQARRCLAL